MVEYREIAPWGIHGDLSHFRCAGIGGIRGVPCGRAVRQIGNLFRTAVIRKSQGQRQAGDKVTADRIVVQRAVNRLSVKIETDARVACRGRVHISARLSIVGLSGRSGVTPASGRGASGKNKRNSTEKCR